MMGDDLRINMHDAIAEAMRVNEGALLGPWVLATATLDEDGQRIVWVLTGPDTVGYEAKGLLAEATDRIQDDGQRHAWFLIEDDEDES